MDAQMEYFYGIFIFIDKSIQLFRFDLDRLEFIHLIYRFYLFKSSY